MPIQDGQAPPQNGRKYLAFYWENGNLAAFDQDGYHYALAVTDVNKGSVAVPPANEPKPPIDESSSEGGNQGGLTTDVAPPPK